TVLRGLPDENVLYGCEADLQPDADAGCGICLCASVFHHLSDALCTDSAAAQEKEIVPGHRRTSVRRGGFPCRKHALCGFRMHRKMAGMGKRGGLLVPGFHTVHRL